MHIQKAGESPCRAVKIFETLDVKFEPVELARRSVSVTLKRLSVDMKNDDRGMSAIFNTDWMICSVFALRN
jgi:hypothetical protein